MFGRAAKTPSELEKVGRWGTTLVARFPRSMVQHRLPSESSGKAREGPSVYGVLCHVGWRREAA